jgi:cohesin loading factor subunit SCC2
LFHAWYSLVRDKRPLRLEFLKAIIKALNVDPHNKNTDVRSSQLFSDLKLMSFQEGVQLTRYIAEIVASLDYKTIEEVLTVIHHTRNVVSVAGMSVMEAWTPSAAEQLNSDLTVWLPIDGVASSHKCQTDLIPEISTEDPIGQFAFSSVHVR